MCSKSRHCVDKRSKLLALPLLQSRSHDCQQKCYSIPVLTVFPVLGLMQLTSHQAEVRVLRVAKMMDLIHMLVHAMQYAMREVHRYIHHRVMDPILSVKICNIPSKNKEVARSDSECEKCKADEQHFLSETCGF